MNVICTPCMMCFCYKGPSLRPWKSVAKNILVITAKHLCIMGNIQLSVLSEPISCQAMQVTSAVSKCLGFKYIVTVNRIDRTCGLEAQLFWLVNMYFINFHVSMLIGHPSYDSNSKGNLNWKGRLILCSPLHFTAHFQRIQVGLTLCLCSLHYFYSTLLSQIVYKIGRETCPIPHRVTYLRPNYGLPSSRRKRVWGVRWHAPTFYPWAWFETRCRGDCKRAC